MEYTISETNGIKYISLRVFPVIQKNKKFYITKIPAKEFLEMYTVEPLEYDIKKLTSLSKLYKEDSEYFDYLISIDTKKIKDKKFQRNIKDDRVKEISKFLNEEEFSLFPNTIIATCDLINSQTESKTFAEFIENNNSDEISFLDHYCFIEEKDNESILHAPIRNNIFLVIDGQHRLVGLKNSKKKVIDDYELLIALLIDYDKSVLAKQFYTINFTQKSVNKSLLYHLSGEFSDEINELTFLHETVRFMNEYEGSAFYKRIKMLGIIPKTQNLTDKEKSQMTISQAFLIDNLINSVSKKALSSIYPPVFINYFNNEEFQIYIIRFILSYFKVISNKLSREWGDPGNFILSKTIGIGSFLRILYFVFIKFYFDKLNQSFISIRNYKSSDFVEILSEYLDGIEKVDYSKKGPYGGVGSEGSLNKLKNDILFNMNIFNFQEEGDFDSFNEKYIKRFREQIRKECK